MNKFFAFLILCGAYCSAFSQALVNNNGASIYVMDGASVIVKTNSLHNLAGGVLNNQGTITVEGDVTNDATINGNGDTIRVYMDWVNNSSYTGNNSWVDLYGDNQNIAGTAVTTFNNLNLGGGTVIKTQQSVNAITSGLLTLNSAELATGTNQMYVSNTTPNAITWSTGFVSSTGAGMLARATNSTSVYTFPVGSPSQTNGPSIFRPVQITPAAANADEYGAMVVKGDATVSGYDVTSFDDSLCAVNPNFFHQLYRVTGNDPVALTMTFDPATDGNWTDQAEWSAPISNLWNYLGPSTAGTALNLSSVTVSGVNNFNPPPFALAKKKFTITSGGPYNITQGQSTPLDPTANTTTPLDSIAWSPASGLSCTNCLTPTASPENTTDYTLLVKDATGCLAIDTILVTVFPGQLLLPTAFSPNGDGENDYFHVLNKNITKVDLQVFNRWGEKVYETEDIDDRGWDGTFKGMKQDMGVFVWQCQYQFTNSSKLLTASGNVTLVR